MSIIQQAIDNKPLIQPNPVQVANAHDFVKQIDQVYDTIKSKLI